MRPPSSDEPPAELDYATPARRKSPSDFNALDFVQLAIVIAVVMVIAFWVWRYRLQ